MKIFLMIVFITFLALMAAGTCFVIYCCFKLGDEEDE